MENYLTRKSAFDLSKLLPGRAVQLISATHQLGETPRKQSAIIKDISLFSVTLLLVSLDNHKDEKLTGRVEEQTFPVEAFEGIGCYKLKRMFAEDELTERTTTTD